LETNNGVTHPAEYTLSRRNTARATHAATHTATIKGLNGSLTHTAPAVTLCDVPGGARLLRAEIPHHRAVTLRT